MLVPVRCPSIRELEDLWQKGSAWKFATNSGLKGNSIGTHGLTFWNVEMEKSICTAMSAEACPLGLLHSTSEELRGLLSAETLLYTCEEVFGCWEKNTVEFICNSKCALNDVTAEIKKMKQESPLKADIEIIIEITR